MFTDCLHFSANQKSQGKVFGRKTSSMGLAGCSHNISVNISEWDDCRNCAEFEHCYKLCMAKLALETGISQS